MQTQLSLVSTFCFREEFDMFTLGSIEVKHTIFFLSRLEVFTVPVLSPLCPLHLYHYSALNRISECYLEERHTGISIAAITNNGIATLGTILQLRMQHKASLVESTAVPLMLCPIPEYSYLFR